MNVEELNFDLPKELIAQHPVYPRDHARLMVLNRTTHCIYHKKFNMIEEFLKAGDILVLNDSKVLKGRIVGKNKKTGGKREIFLLKEINDSNWLALLSPYKRAHEGDIILVSDVPPVCVEVVKKMDNGENLVSFKTCGLPMEEVLRIYGELPTPPYIKGKIDNEQEYQTVYARVLGSVASPTAGLHFTKGLLNRLRTKGVLVDYVTLHVGLDTFQPVTEENIDRHKMHEEEFVISEETAQRINEAKAKGGRLFACGTTVVRSLETASTRDGVLKSMHGRTQLFIKPGYRFKIVDAMITNFHFPRTTLLALVMAFAGKDFILSAYETAIKEKYRFFSFGDAMLIL